ncbi:MAG: hypothetical protein PHC63_06275 [Candidatus Bathyarchaeota archaeon]|nr:hypothetical protein [Candidatus Bathyarchaeota archaeon]MDI9578921.1 hypothetical protein [Thermoproteota archaeon]
MGCLKRAYILVKRHVEEIALERPPEQTQRSNNGFLAKFRKKVS